MVCVVSVGHAGRYFYARREESLQTVPVLQTRLLREVWSFTKELLQDVSFAHVSRMLTVGRARSRRGAGAEREGASASASG